ncbi:hypothetical protein HPB51_025672 [Rhipicephalus microplus]|uniref:Protein zer-1 homolog-like C-terminal domain-containing protein n=1 Tax=Rhipicephalus microplus TaxID=6941 RepID=A0A9J6EKA9_RHIMP|nr:hypothetical protein HPB51_025672 [Rhipicephalus microplus]
MNLAAPEAAKYTLNICSNCFHDETPVNCERFLDGGGMNLFLRCLRQLTLYYRMSLIRDMLKNFKQIFTDKPELLRNMMGLLGNVAEVKELRPRLMQDKYLLVFSELLDSESDGIEVSYNAAGILAHILSDGPESWEKASIQAVSRDEVLMRMRRAIDRWALITKRNINYRSFEPILRLLSCEHTPEALHWAVWALANLTQVYRDRDYHTYHAPTGMPLACIYVRDGSTSTSILILPLIHHSLCQRLTFCGTSE